MRHRTHERDSSRFRSRNPAKGTLIADPKFLEASGLRKFDFRLANPMWNQDGYRDLMENDRFGTVHVWDCSVNNAADWGWIQHMLASLKPDWKNGSRPRPRRLFRGGTEGEIRKKVVGEDLIE